MSLKKPFPNQRKATERPLLSFCKTSAGKQTMSYRRMRKDIAHGTRLNANEECPHYVRIRFKKDSSRYRTSMHMQSTSSLCFSSGRPWPKRCHFHDVTPRNRTPEADCVMLCSLILKRKSDKTSKLKHTIHTDTVHIYNCAPMSRVWIVSALY